VRVASLGRPSRRPGGAASATRAVGVRAVGSATNWRLRRVAWLAVAVGLAAGLTACTNELVPEPTPTPTPAETSEPAPSGVRVGVVLPAPTDPVAVAFHDVEDDLDALAAERKGDIASVRAVVPDERQFEPDLAALLAEEGADLVCILGTDGPRTARQLADRFPATRFCALGVPREVGPDNLDLFEVAYEELGHVLGVVVDSASPAAPVAIVLGDESEPRTRRRAGARAALTGADPLVDVVIGDATAAAELTGDDAPRLATAIVDVSDPGVAAVVAAAARSWIGPRALPIDTSETDPLLRWSVRADVVVDTAVQRLISPSAPVQPPLGFAEEVFSLSFASDAPEAVRSASLAAADEIVAGTREPLAPQPPRPTSDGGSEEEADGPATG
jgi:hypothetical protein